MSHYPLSIFCSDEDEGFIAELPELPQYCSLYVVIPAQAGSAPQQTLCLVIHLDLAVESKMDPSLRWDDDGLTKQYWGLPGCSTWGSTAAEATREAISTGCRQTGERVMSS